MLQNFSGCGYQTIHPGIPFARAYDPAGYPVAVEAAGLRSGPPFMKNSDYFARK
jgi:hypothetical protein